MSPRPTAPVAADVVRGEVLEVRVFRDSWGRARVRGVEGPVVGDVLGVSVGDTIEARGQWGEHPVHGRQFKAQTISATVPTDSRGVVAWLAARLPGLGEKRATAIVTKWPPPELYTVLDQTPERLAELDGISAKTAVAAGAEYQRVKGEALEMTTLLGWGLTEGQIKRCREVWASKVLEVLREDPYRLAEEVHGFGFARADVIARKMGLPHDHPRRIQACLVHILGVAEGEGHCYVLRGVAIKKACAGLGVAPPQVARELDHVIEQERIRVGGGERLYLPGTLGAELAIGSGVLRLLGRESEAA